MSDAILGIGTTLSYASYPTPSTFTAVAEVIDVGWPDVTSGEVDVTHYGTTGSFKEFLPSAFKEGGEFEALLNFTTAGYIAVAAIQNIKKTWKITLPGGNYLQFPGHIKGLAGEIPIEDRVTNTVTIKVDGEIEFFVVSGSSSSSAY